MIACNITFAQHNSQSAQEATMIPEANGSIAITHLDISCVLTKDHHENSFGLLIAESSHFPIFPSGRFPVQV
jgi:hypothetical protein